jgi:hypothetical protein
MPPRDREAKFASQEESIGKENIGDIVKPFDGRGECCDTTPIVLEYETRHMKSAQPNSCSSQQPLYAASAALYVLNIQKI